MSRCRTCNRLDLETLGSRPTMSKNLPGHRLLRWCLKRSVKRTWTGSIFFHQWECLQCNGHGPSASCAKWPWDRTSFLLKGYLIPSVSSFHLDSTYFPIAFQCTRQCRRSASAQHLAVGQAVAEAEKSLKGRDPPSHHSSFNAIFMSQATGTRRKDFLKHMWLPAQPSPALS